MNVRPIRDMVLIARDKSERITKGGIVLPEIGMEERRPWRGTVLAVGPGVVRTAKEWLEPGGTLDLTNALEATPIEEPARLAGHSTIIDPNCTLDWAPIRIVKHPDKPTAFWVTRRHVPQVEAGDRVYFHQWTGYRFLPPPADPQDQLLVRAADILCVLE